MNLKQIYKNKILLLLIATLSVGLLSASCSGGQSTSKEKITLTLWKPFVDSDKMNVIIQAYKKKKPNVTIEYTKKNIENYESDLLNALAAGSGPDIFSINNTWTAQYKDKIVSAPAGLYTLKEYKDAFVDVVNDDFVYDNQIFGTAMWVDSLGLYYNKDLLGTAGIATPAKTWNELAVDSRKVIVQDASGVFTRSGVAMGLSENVNRGVDILYLLMLQAGVKPWSDDGRSPQFASGSGGEDATTFYTSFANPNSGNYTWNARSDYSVDAFANGRAAYLYGYSYTREQIDAKSPNLNYDVAQVPQKQLGTPDINYASYFAEVVSKQSKHQKEAWEFLKYATSKEALDLYYAKDKQPSSRRDLIELQTSDLEIGVFAHANLTAKSFYKPNEAKFDSIIGEMIEAIVIDRQNVSSALSRAQSQASALVRSTN
ncbi:MAG: extracellular solute-binding protein [Candidatus Doudnabacteria bacterium]